VKVRAIVLFKKELAKKILEGKKVQTRRPAKRGTWITCVDGKKTVYNKSRIKWQVGRDYAVCYGYGRPTRWHRDGVMLMWRDYVAISDQCDDVRDVLADQGWMPMRIKLTDIFFEDVREISRLDAIAEGLGSPEGFLRVWCDFYDANASIDNLTGRPAHRYHGWALSFELITK
jgi:hypothetical protein